jgi:ABC-2 type transport system ATP-binding protein
MPEGTAVRFDRATKRFGTFTAVDALSFEVPRGSIFGLLGQNGAGKTTSIRMLMNIVAPDEGRVEVFGQAMNEGLKERLGYLPEERGLYKKMRMRELLLFFGRIKGREPAFLEARIDRWVQRMGLTDWLTRRVEELSKGMAQKVQFIATVVHEPDLLVLDEPFAGLDPVNRDVMRDAVLELRATGTTVLFSTHVMEQAESLCDRILLINRGRSCLQGTVDEVRRREGREAAFVRLAAADPRGFQGLPGVVSAANQGTEAELVLSPAAEPTQLLRALMDRGEVLRFEVRTPSLHEIFKRAVGATSPAEGPARTGEAPK